MTGTTEMRRLEGKIAVLAGGAGGIGTATGVRLAREGAAVVIGDLDVAAAEAVAARVRAAGGRAIAAAVDLADRGTIDALFAAADEAFGGVDLVHCNAAAINLLVADTDASEIDAGVWDATLAINLTGYLHCTRAAVPRLLARGGGAIVYTSSGAAFVGEPTRVAYAVTKAGVNALARHVASRWGAQGIRANVIAPGLVMTPALDHLGDDFKAELLGRTPSPRHGVPDDIAAMVAMLMSPDGEWINGQVLSVDGGVTMR